MEHNISATALARSLGDVLARVRYRQESFVVERNGKPIARLLPVEPRAGDVRLRDALAAWCDAPADPAFADDLERVGAADRAPMNPWES
jgi:prevent-host-death family protein